MTPSSILLSALRRSVTIPPRMASRLTSALEAALASLGLPFARSAFGVRTESQLVQWALAKQGVGMCVMMDEVGDADPAVRRALPELPGLVFPTWLTTHRELKTSRRIRAVFEHLAARLHAGVAP